MIRVEGREQDPDDGRGEEAALMLVGRGFGRGRIDRLVDATAYLHGLGFTGVAFCLHRYYFNTYCCLDFMLWRDNLIIPTVPIHNEALVISRCVFMRSQWHKAQLFGFKRRSSS